MTTARGSALKSARYLVGALGGVLVLLVTFGIPLGFGLHHYGDHIHQLDFKAQLNAGRLAEFIASPGGSSWRRQQDDLAEMIMLPEGEGGPVRQRILDEAGGVVMENGPALDGPLLARSAPIVVMGAEIGRIEVATSVLPLLLEVALMAVSCLLLGVAAFFGLILFPLRMLERTVGELELQNLRFNTALNNMIHGLSMFDADKRLVVCNQRYRELYGLPEALTQPGATLEEIMTFRAHDEAFVGADPEEYKQKLLALEQNDKALSTAFQCRNGRVISMRLNPMPGGGWVAAHEDVTEQREASARIAYLAHHDALTGLANRVLLRERLGDLLSKVASDGSLAVLCLDLDNFKDINDTLGHAFGDTLLKHVAERLRCCVGEGDVVARMGGDEFTVVQSGGAQPESAVELANRLIERVSAPYDIDGQRVRVGTSVGVALVPDAGLDADHLMRSADVALYRAKAEGGGVCRVFEPEMIERMRSRRRLESDLREALLRGEFELHYQPLLNLKDGVVEGVEALLRWNHPERGRIPPAEFIPVAEEIGFIVPLGEWVLRQACSDAVTLPEHVRVAVNLSPVQFKANNLVASVFHALSVSGLAVERLELEITESVLLEDTEASIIMLHQLRALGVRIAMDDFGTGYSSLSYLQRFPFDKIKLDKSFVQGLGQQPGSQAVLRAVASLGFSLCVDTTAEGVETEQQLLAVKAEGISQVQGYLVSEPKPIGEIRKLLAGAALRHAGRGSAA